MMSTTSVERYTYAIIGGGIAGVTCAEHLEIVDGERSVVLISGSDLIKAVTNVLHLSRSIDIFHVEDRHHAYLSQLCPTVTVKPATVTKMDPVNKLLHLSSGAVVEYEKLCVCCGASPKVLYAGHPHVLYIRDTESVLHFQSRIANASRIIIVGNGGIATEMVYEITGVEVVWAVKDSWFTAAFIDPGAAEFFRPELSKSKAAKPAVTKRKKYTVDNLQISEVSAVGSGSSKGLMGGALGPDWLDCLDLRPNLSKEKQQKSQPQEDWKQAPQQQQTYHQNYKQQNEDTQPEQKDNNQKDHQEQSQKRQQQNDDSQEILQNPPQHQKHGDSKEQQQQLVHEHEQRLEQQQNEEQQEQQQLRRVHLETKVEVVALHSPEQMKTAPDLQQRVETQLFGGNGEKEWSVFVELSNGKIFGCDFVVSATGVTPNTTLLRESAEFEYHRDGGVSVGEDMQTTVPGVYAAGDVCSPSWPCPPHWQQMRLWTQARQMGSYAAKCMWASVTQQEIYQDFCFELFTHATRFFGHKVVMLGLYNGQKLDGKYDILLRMTRGVEYIKVVMKEGKMQGALLIGETDLEETFENLILNQMDLSSYGEDLLDPDVDIEDYFD